ncbi:DNA polymerase III subunit epsilon [Neptuniibacter sp. QD37_11]|uniref:DNA polymerase III subunit epsilon n=1 Tax=Neptuniibacter sp. QD37_11 TaxID=3398209 RepID=UPI0039F4FD0C
MSDFNLAGEIVIFDTETTGIDPETGDKIVEFGAIVVNNRKVTEEKLQLYFDPERDIPEETTDIHGIDNESIKELSNGMIFADHAQGLWDFLQGRQWAAHNASFDVGFLDAEFVQAGFGKISDHMPPVFDTLKYAQQANPNQRNSLDALCKRFGIDLSERTDHGALLDSQLLADVFLLLTTVQTDLSLTDDKRVAKASNLLENIVRVDGSGLNVLKASETEAIQHLEKINSIRQKSEKEVDWDYGP